MASVSWTVASSVFRDEAVLGANLMRSPALPSSHQVLIQRGHSTVSAAYNQALRDAQSDLVVFTHPDVYLPATFSSCLAAAVEWLDKHDPAWAVLGLVGSRCDRSIAGFTYSVGLGSFVGKPLDVPERVRTVDEFVFAVRKSSGLSFDEALPGAQSQLCAADICLEAERRGRGVYVIPAFVLHNSNGWSYLPLGFWKPYLYMRRKWSAALPIYVPYARITRWCLPMIRNSIRALRGGKKGHRSRSRVDDVESLYGRIRASVTGLFGLENAGQHASAEMNDGSGPSGVGAAANNR